MSPSTPRSQPPPKKVIILGSSALKIGEAGEFEVVGEARMVAVGHVVLVDLADRNGGERRRWQDDRIERVEDRVDVGDRPADDIWFGSAAGHSPGQLTLNIDLGGEKLVFTGDLFHSPLQIARPEWSSKFDVDRAAAAETRRRFIGEHADEDAVILSAHVNTPNAGRIVTEDGRTIFRLLEKL